jgi:putative spermidine/putrescine transport system ATP-binding protein
VRAAKLKLVAAGTTAAEDTISVPAVVETVDYQGQAARYFIRVGERQLQAVNMIDERPFAEGETVALQLRGRDCATLPGNG